jgi:hypothetical protein
MVGRCLLAGQVIDAPVPQKSRRHLQVTALCSVECTYTLPSLPTASPLPPFRGKQVILASTGTATGRPVSSQCASLLKGAKGALPPR